MEQECYACREFYFQCRQRIAPLHAQSQPRLFELEFRV